MIVLNIEMLTAIGGVLVGLLGLVLGWRKAALQERSDIRAGQERARDAEETARSTDLALLLTTYKNLADVLRLDLQTLRTEVRTLRAENGTLRDEIHDLRLALASYKESDVVADG